MEVVEVVFNAAALSGTAAAGNNGAGGGGVVGVLPVWCFAVRCRRRVFLRGDIAGRERVSVLAVQRRAAARGGNCTHVTVRVLVRAHSHC